MVLRRLFASALVGALLLTNVPLTINAEEVSGTGTGNAESSFDSSVMYSSADLVVMIPDEVPLELNDAGDAFEGKGFVTAWGKVATSSILTVTTDTSITYTHELSSLIKADATVSFGTNGVSTWNGTELRANVEAIQKVGYDVIAEVPLENITDIGTYRSVINFNISLDYEDNDDSGDEPGDEDDDTVVDYIDGEEDYIYYQKTYNGVEGYAVYGLSDNGLAKASATAEAGETFVLDVPNTYNGMPVVALDFGGSNVGGLSFSAVEPEKYHDISLVCGDNVLYIEGAWNDTIAANSFVNKITNITLNSGVLNISNDAFKNATGLKTITLPASLTSIGSSAFANTTSLETIVFEEGFNANLGDYVFGNSGVKELSLPSSMTSFNLSAFRDSNLSVVHFDNVSASVEVNGNADYKQYLDFTDVDYLGLRGDSYKVVATLDEDYNIHVANDADLAVWGTDSYDYIDKYQSNGSIIILEEGITTIATSLRTAKVQLPSTITDITKGGVFTKATLTGDTDFRDVTLIEDSNVFGNVKAENLTLLAGQFDNMGDNVQITNLYIENVGGCTYNNYTKFTDVQNIYFSGSEDEWNTFKSKLIDFDSTFTGTIHFNQSF